MAADYTIHFPPSLWNSLLEEQRTWATSKGHGELELDEKTKNFLFNELVEEWEDKITFNPIRGEPEPDNADRDNNALFYGTGGTGKTSLARRITYNIENVLEDDYSLERESQRWSAFYLFIDEADNVCANTAYQLILLS